MPALDALASKKDASASPTLGNGVSSLILVKGSQDRGRVRLGTGFLSACPVTAANHFSLERGKHGV